MADEARLVIELVEGSGGVSGSPGRPSSGPSIPSQKPGGTKGADVPESQAPKPSRAKVPPASQAPDNSLAAVLKKLRGSSTVQTTNQIISKGAPAVAGALSKAGLGSAASAVGSSAAAAAGILGATGPVGLGVAGATAAVGLPIAAAAGTAAIASSAANSLARVSPDIAAARANAQVAQTMQQLRSAQVIGPELAEFTTAVSDIKIEMTRARDLFLDKVAEPLADLLSIVASLQRGVNDFLESEFVQWLISNTGFETILAGISAIKDFLVIRDAREDSPLMFFGQAELPTPGPEVLKSLGVLRIGVEINPDSVSGFGLGAL